MKIITLHKKRYKYAESWQELDGNQRRQITQLVERPMDHNDLRMQLLVALLKIKPKVWQRLKFEEVYPLLPLVDFVLDHFKISVYGPGDNLELATFGEFRRWEKWVNLYQGSKDADYKIKCLEHILAILYRPARADYDPEKHQDRREPYEEWKTEKYLEAIRSYPTEEKEILAEKFFVARDGLMKLFPNLFKRVKNVDGKREMVREDQEKGKTVQQKNEWIQVLRKLSRTPIDFQKIDNLPATDVLFDLNERIRELDEVKAKNKAK